MPKRILIVGCSGAGKSTLARAIGAQTGLPVVHLDKLYWRDGWTHVPEEEFDALLQAELDRPCWVMDGNFTRTLPMRLAQADAVVWLDYPTIVCLIGMFRRVTLLHGKVRPDMGPNCPERFDRAFIKHILSYRKAGRVKLEKAFSAQHGCEVYRLCSRRQARAFLKTLQAER